MRTSSVIRIAWRNLGRNRRRTALAIAAVSAAQLIVLFYSGLLNGERAFLLDAISGPLIGHAQIHAAGWREDRSVDRVLPHTSALLEHLRANPDVVRASARVYAPALVALRDEGHAVMLVGVESQTEAGPQGMLEGVESESLPGNRRVVVGYLLADIMGIHKGDALAVVGQASDGSIANELYTVAAVARSPVDVVSRMGVVMSLSDAQELLSMADSSHEIALRANNSSESRALVARLQADPLLAGTDVASWQDLVPLLATMLRVVDVTSWIVLAILFFAAGVGVANTLLTSTFERTREFGMLLALGVRPFRLVRLLLAEATQLGMLGVLLGSAAGIALILVTHQTGLDLTALSPNREAASSLSVGGLTWSMRFFPTAGLADVVRAVAAILFTAALSALWPAVRLARLQPTEAMRS